MKWFFKSAVNCRFAASISPHFAAVFMRRRARRSSNRRQAKRSRPVPDPHDGLAGYPVVSGDLGNALPVCQRSQDGRGPGLILLQRGDDSPSCLFDLPPPSLFEDRGPALCGLPVLGLQAAAEARPTKNGANIGGDFVEGVPEAATKLEIHGVTP